jgi:hypothetical protein
MVPVLGGAAPHPAALAAAVAVPQVIAHAAAAAAQAVAPAVVVHQALAPAAAAAPAMAPAVEDARLDVLGPLLRHQEEELEGIRQMQDLERIVSSGSDSDLGPNEVNADGQAFNWGRHRH